ncbi:hypothetical protein M758_7G165700 [Ceratodon purpureus]|nr:hypothetical protein M758_7G165700 [Ceratodon purpureus]KAG0611803.1 hypothetical protein M758_7G165700 [Ceratodon purpureus]KAG0611804.1 hypothetical protein M758_7G165700 [Ceratodon purpureus]
MAVAFTAAISATTAGVPPSRKSSRAPLHKTAVFTPLSWLDRCYYALCGVAGVYERGRVLLVVRSAYLVEARSKSWSAVTVAFLLHRFGCGVVALLLLLPSVCRADEAAPSISITAASDAENSCDLRLQGSSSSSSFAIAGTLMLIPLVVSLRHPERCICCSCEGRCHGLALHVLSVHVLVKCLEPLEQSQNQNCS